MSTGPRTRTLLKATSTARRQAITASYSALTQVCVATADNAVEAELVSEHPTHAWELPRSNALGLVHTDVAEARALLRSAQLLEHHRVPVVTPRYPDALTGGGRAVTFWRLPGRERHDPATSARVTARIHRIDPGTVRWLARENHDPFNGLLDGLDNAPVLDPCKPFLRDRAYQLRDEWAAIDWPTPSTTILGAHRAARCHSDGTLPRLLLRQPLLHGHREWDLIAARWRSDLLLGHLNDTMGYTEAYSAHADAHVGVPYGHIGAWPDYQVVRDVIVLTEVMSTVRRAHLDARTRQQADYQVACLRGARRRPWNWGR
ncbi:hypothetical protein BX285_5011 [Streptomyces sp. 1114.5]|uniref:hypothetical protein n=1 Tax=Streptomyces sp. 1114.5 TaxID=1938830 RepID=UPI000EAF45CF|nr:hypothetical protein [Streptomyces sp. 1114.5]RKT11076.1 hypothetical protein BX285_5011 [Streptomyces sp. 1114.5]